MGFRDIFEGFDIFGDFALFQLVWYWFVPLFDAVEVVSSGESLKWATACRQFIILS